MVSKGFLLFKRLPINQNTVQPLLRESTDTLDAATVGNLIRGPQGISDRVPVLARHCSVDRAVECRPAWSERV
jgi:hypothetical protein